MENYQNVAPCPVCGQQNASPANLGVGGLVGLIAFGLIGIIFMPYLNKKLHSVKCNVCDTNYNGKSGKTHTKILLILLFITIVIVSLCIMILIALLASI